MKRFIVKLGSETAHCCFEATVIDTGVESRCGNVCECLCEEDAHHIAKALNDYAEAIEKERKNNIAEKELTMPKRGDTHISDAIEQYHEEERNMRQNERYIALATGLIFAGFVLLGVAWAVIQ